MLSCAEDHDDDGVVGRGGHGTSATDTSASIAIALTRAWLVALPRTSAAIEVTRLSAISGHDLRPDLGCRSRRTVCTRRSPSRH